MRLIDLAGEAEDGMAAVSLAEAVEVTGLTADSRKVAPGFLFAALPGGQTDGRDFIDEAVDKGAVAVLAPAGAELNDSSRPIALGEEAKPRPAAAPLVAGVF